MPCTEKENPRELDEFLLQLVDSGHTAIFQWIAVWLGSGIGLIQIILEVLKTPKPAFPLICIYGFIYLVLILLMTFAVYSVLHVMHNQNKWINQLSKSRDDEKKLFFKSRSQFSKLLVNKSCEMSLASYLIVGIHFVILCSFGITVLFVRNIYAIWPDLLLHRFMRFIMRLFS